VTHLLNFQPYQPDRSRSGIPSGSRRRRLTPFKKEVFLQANYRFSVAPPASSIDDAKLQNALSVRSRAPLMSSNMHQAS